ncbi:hypothetical protein F8S09_05340 [Deinococcus sp. SDU3-2]|uniref:GNAT family N-acetyltransferase n=1 Tax=Deinococcus terrestris TaxID=2651870 RepID=A0A7X1NUM9_9DEIO|nr:hypothetical protein [Deinococcus terrestris]MPY66122.1 hypothetical protein [Deinococcus terrestris]
MTIVTTADHPHLHTQAGEAFRERWPEFIFHDPVPARLMPQVHSSFPDYNVLLLEGERALAGGWGVTFAWDGTFADLPDGYGGALVRAVTGRETGTRPNTLCFMAASVAVGADRRGLAAEVLGALTGRARAAGLTHVVAPLRPTWKHRYPQVPMAEYARWQRGDGLSIDPWIRTHQRLGATILGPAPRSMVIEGRVADWEAWTEMVFPVTGLYFVPDALGWVHIDREEDRGLYVEENLWVQHPALTGPAR